MDQTIDVTDSVERRVADFYDTLAPDYDVMTGFEKRFVHERPFFRLLVERYRIKSAIDAGCGSGFHSLLLASLGVRVTAVDMSDRMLALLEGHAHERGVTVAAIQSNFLSLPTLVQEHFDAVFCMGNTLVHLLTTEELRASLNSFANVTKPGGILFMQILNYERILMQREMIQSVKEVPGVTFVRYYEYKGEKIYFHILKQRKGETGPTRELSTVELRPILKNELNDLLRKVGFTDVKFFGGITMEEFQPQTSKDLVVLATSA